MLQLAVEGRDVLDQRSVHPAVALKRGPALQTL
jgi:hypothetical protein